MMLVAVGVLGLVKGSFVPTWAPAPRILPAHGMVAYLCALVSLVGGLGLLLPRSRTLAAGVLVSCFALWLLMTRIPSLWRAPAMQGAWWVSAETTAYVAGAWALYARFAAYADGRHVPFAAGLRGERIARALFGLALVPFGSAHFVFLKETVVLVPRYLPFAPVAWAYFTGAAFIAAGLAILVGRCARLAALLSTLQLAGFTLLVWVPIVIAGANAFQWSEFVVSCALTAVAWVITDSYHGTPWLAFGLPRGPAG